LGKGLLTQTHDCKRPAPDDKAPAADGSPVNKKVLFKFLRSTTSNTWLEHAVPFQEHSSKEYYVGGATSRGVWRKGVGGKLKVMMLSAMGSTRT